MQNINIIIRKLHTINFTITSRPDGIVVTAANTILRKVGGAEVGLVSGDIC